VLQFMIVPFEPFFAETADAIVNVNCNWLHAKIETML
jgi:hypothetical protein